MSVIVAITARLHPPIPTPTVKEGRGDPCASWRDLGNASLLQLCHMRKEAIMASRIEDLRMTEYLVA